MIVWTHSELLGVMCMCFVCLYLHCSAQLRLFHLERRCRNTLIIIIVAVMMMMMIIIII